MAPTLLHGILYITISKGEEQVNEKWKLSPGPKLYATIDLDEAPAGSITLGDQKHFTLGMSEPNPFYCAHVVSGITFIVRGGGTSLATVDVPVDEDILDGKEIVALDRSRVPTIHVKLKFLDVTKDRNWGKGVGSGEFFGVPNTSFAQRKRCKVSLYQDTHVPDTFSPKITLDGGQTYQPQRCWEDIFDAIKDAKHIIYITGWCFSPEITLVRDTSRHSSGRDTKLGELLKRKAEEGVTVLMLIWDDMTTTMRTRSKETEKYFRDTRVHCVVCTRKSNGGGLLKNVIMPLIYTHHQKTVVVDTKLPSGGPASDQRGIVSFVGGIDLCVGRYDTQHHSLFRTLNTEHKDDFYQPNFPADSSMKETGPRQPWHDIHARVEGPVAWDVLRTFEQRWSKQGVKGILPRELNDNIIPQSQSEFAEDDDETWNVQLFRSIDGGAAFGLANNYHDRSIQDAYINAIRRAKKFIYIESQYFLGSSFAWGADDDIKLTEVGALNLIPKELSLKIVSKIKAKERFTVYIVVPMWPEGDPETSTVQTILDLQRRTMQMMYEDIIQALNTEGIKEDPRNYLTFFCLGNREVESTKHTYDPPTERPDQDSTNYRKAQEARRFMIYVHSKMMIVDDEYIIIGSSNINQRSMDGARDTEIAIGAYQPNHLATGSMLARGQIHGFRKSLWYEHLGTLLPCFDNPEREECVRTVNRLAETNWDLYSREEPLKRDLPGHLLRYPVGISDDGTIIKLQGFECFPDTKAHVLGELHMLLKRGYGGSPIRKKIYEVCSYRPELARYPHGNHSSQLKKKHHNIMKEKIYPV